MVGGDCDSIEVVYFNCGGPGERPWHQSLVLAVG